MFPKFYFLTFVDLTPILAFPDFSIIDLKALFRGYRYVEETIKLLPQKPDPILLANIFHKVTNLGRIHPTTTCSSGS
jgi:putative transposase